MAVWGQISCPVLLRPTLHDLWGSPTCASSCTGGGLREGRSVVTSPAGILDCELTWYALQAHEPRQPECRDHPRFVFRAEETTDVQKEPDRSRVGETRCRSVIVQRPSG